MTVIEIKAIFPEMTYVNIDGVHTIVVKDYNTNKFSIQGTGGSEVDAWHEAYEWRTRTGRFDPMNEELF